MASTKALRQKARRLGQTIGNQFFHAAQCGLCPICNETIDLQTATLSYDHVFPLQAGTENQTLHQGNLLLVHERCNRKKGNRQPTTNERSVLQMVNEILGFDEATGTYQRRQSLLNVYNERLKNTLRAIERKEAAVNQDQFGLAEVQQLEHRVLIFERDMLTEKIAFQREVFNTYQYLYDLS